VNALVQPVNLLVGALVAVVALLLEPWLFLVAAGAYVALVLITFFDEAEAARVRHGGPSASHPGLGKVALTPAPEAPVAPRQPYERIRGARSAQSVARTRASKRPRPAVRLPTPMTTV
jgi:hypothetical protein